MARIDDTFPPASELRAAPPRPVVATLPEYVQDALLELEECEAPLLLAHVKQLEDTLSEVEDEIQQAKREGDAPSQSLRDQSNFLAALANLLRTLVESQLEGA